MSKESADIEYHCRVCGREFPYPTWTVSPLGDSNQVPTHGICPCCGCEFGLNDTSPRMVQRYREKWLEQGAPWFSKRHSKPEDWTKQAALAQIQSGVHVDFQ